MGTHKIYSGIQGIWDNISGSLYGDCHELLAGRGVVHVYEKYFILAIKITFLNLNNV